jgi:hypothetical protein
MNGLQTVMLSFILFLTVFLADEYPPYSSNIPPKLKKRNCQISTGQGVRYSDAEEDSRSMV